jgi:hypothetical protein
MRTFFHDHFDALSERVMVIAAMAAALGQHALVSLAWRTFFRVCGVILGSSRSIASAILFKTRRGPVATLDKSVL